MLLKKYLFCLIALLLMGGSSLYAATYAKQVDAFISGIHKLDGSLNSRGKVYFYDPSDQTTAKAVYKDGTKTSQWVQPIILDALGRQRIFGDGKYYIKIYDTNNVFLYDINNASYETDSLFSSIYVDILTNYGNTATNIQSAINDYTGTTNVTFLFKETQGGYTISSSLVFPSNVDLKFIKGAYFNTFPNTLVTIVGNIDTPIQTIFDGSGDITITPSNNQTLYPNWFGVVADNETDNTVDFNRCFKTAQGKKVHLPAGGIYRVAGELGPSSNTEFVGDGIDKTIIMAASVGVSSNAVIHPRSVNHVRIANMTIQGASIDPEIPSSLISFQNSDFNTIENVKLWYASHAGIDFNEDSDYNTIINCDVQYIKTTVGVGIFIFSDGDHNKIINNTVKFCGSYHILVDGGTSGGDSLPSNFNIVEGNHIYSDDSTDSSGWGIGIEGSNYCVVKNNTIVLENLASYALLSDPDNATPNNYPVGVIFDSNIISVNVIGARIDGSGIMFKNNNIKAGQYGLIFGNSGDLTTTRNGNVFSGNYFECGYVNDVGNPAVYLAHSYSENTRFFDNEIASANAQGLRIDNGSVVVAGNRIHNTGSAAIKTTFENNKIVIENNYLFDYGINNIDGEAAGIFLASPNVEGGQYDGILIRDNIFDSVRFNVQSGLFFGGGPGCYVNTIQANNLALSSAITIDTLSLANPTQINANDRLRVGVIGGLGDGISSPNASITGNIGAGMPIVVTLNQNLMVMPGGDTIVGAEQAYIFIQDSTGGWEVTFNPSAFLTDWDDTRDNGSGRQAANPGSRAYLQFIYDGFYWVQKTKPPSWKAP